MTDQELNIALAEWFGYKWLRVDDAFADRELWTLQYDHFRSGSLGPVAFEVVDRLPMEAKKWRYTGPRFTEDLNAVHKLEKKLSMHQWAVYLRHIVPAETNWMPEGDDIPNAFSLICHADASKRCEALAKTLSLWKE